MLNGRITIKDSNNIIEIINKLNREILDIMFDNECDKSYMSPFEFKTNGNVICIRFLGYHVPYSFEDLRCFSKEKNELECFEMFLRNQANGILNILNNVKL